MTILTMTAKLIGKGHGQRIVPFPDKKSNDVLGLSFNEKTKTVTIEYQVRRGKSAAEPK